MRLQQLLLSICLALVALVLPVTSAMAASVGCDGWNANWNVDGLYGPNTRQAVMNYQRAHKLRVDGVAGPQTLRSMHLAYHRTLRCGTASPDVKSLQQALEKQGFWNGEQAAAPQAAPTAKPAPVKATPKPKAPAKRPTPTPAPMTTPEPTPAPVLEQSTPVPTIERSPEAATPEPTPMPTATPAPETYNPVFDLEAGAWYAAPSLPAGSTSQFLPTGSANLWLGDWGIGGDALGLNSNANILYDGVLEHRWGGFRIFLGYQGLNAGVTNMGTIGAALDQPLGIDWLRLQLRAQGSSNFSYDYFYGGNAGLAIGPRPIALELGYRTHWLQAGANATMTTLEQLNGPYAALKLQF